MVLTIEISNAEIFFALYRQQERLLTFHIGSNLRQTDCEYAVLLQQLLVMKNFDARQIKGAVIASVVPPLTAVIKSALHFLNDEMKLYVVGPGLKTGLNIKIENPADLGADFAAIAVGTLARYDVPALVFCVGETATKVLVLNEQKQFIGGTILPGVLLSLKGLTDNSAQLPAVSLAGSIRLLSSNTQECMRSGAILGHASMMDGIVQRYEQEMGAFRSIIACGTMAQQLLPHCRTSILPAPYLLHDGLLEIYRRVSRR